MHRLGIPSGAGACGVGQDQAPRALRDAGLIAALQAAGAYVEDIGDSPVTPRRPDRTMPHAQNLSAVVDAVQSPLNA
jgi:arginase